jgi:hypothetical protein
VTIEGFEDGNLSRYAAAGTNFDAAAIAGAAHDGGFGLSFRSNNYFEPAGWLYRNDAQVAIQRGERISAWIQFTTQLDGRA